MATRVFITERHHMEIVSKGTLFKVLKHIDKGHIETPVLLMDEDRVREKVRRIGKKIRMSKAFYAVKANPDPEVLKFIGKLGMGFEIASEGELRVLSAQGVAPERIITSNPMKSVKFIREAAGYGVKYFAFDSTDEVDKMAAHARGASLYVRLSVPNEGSEWPLSKKFGVELEDALDLLVYARDKGLDPAGITFHVGSQCTNIYNWDIAINKAKVLWDMAAGKGIALRMLNIGGGYPIKYTKGVVGIEEIEKNVDGLIAANFPQGTEVFIEPGRAVVGDAGIFVTSVTGKARRGDENWLYINVGVFNGLMESLGGIRYSYLVESDRKRKVSYTLAGPSCDSFDVIDKEVSLPEPEVGGLVLVLSGGAYTVSYASEFNGFSIPRTKLI